MMVGKQISFLPPVVHPADIVYTPEYVSKNIIDHLKPEGVCLDPCKGDGAFLKYLPGGSDFCEINEGRDFFDYYSKVNWVIGNPPYSIFDKFLEHAFSISENVSFFSSYKQSFPASGYNADG